MLQGNGRFGVTNDVHGVNGENPQGKAWFPESHPSIQCRPTTVTGVDRNADDVDSVIRYGHVILARMVRDLDAREARLRHVELRQLPQQHQPAPARHMVTAIGPFLPADSRAVFFAVSKCPVGDSALSNTDAALTVPI